MGGQSDAGDDATPGPNPFGDDGGGAPPPTGQFSSDGGGAAMDCKAGHYTGSFMGSYTSYLTDTILKLGGVPLMVTGNVDLDLDQSVSTTTGEIHESTLTIANGHVQGFANNVFPYQCDMVGTLDCNTKKLVDAGLENCWYCVGLFVQQDGGNCSAYGHFKGPVAGDYNGKTFSFMDGTWEGQEMAPTGDGGYLLPDGGGINDAGLYVGPGNYGGSGTWNAKYGGDN
jgi:hypothetical protein